MSIIVIKIGTDSISNQDGSVNHKVMVEVTQQIHSLQSLGHKVALVSSGAIGLGYRSLGLLQKPQDSITQRMCAMVGQPVMIQKWLNVMDMYSIKAGQCLLNSKDLSNDQNTKNLFEVIQASIDNNIVPIINENDVISDEEVKTLREHKNTFVDNDALARLVAIGLGAKKLFILSAGIDGLYKDYNSDNKEIFQVVDDFERIYESIHISKSSGGTGGMQAKIDSISKAVEAGIEVYLINSYNSINISRAVENNRDFVGTKFVSKN
jgi:glutamate 5-kinase